MKKLTDLINESGAGFWGTTSAKDKLASDTPGQGVKKKKLTDMATENTKASLVEMKISFKFETLQDAAKAERKAIAMGLETSSEKMKGNKVWLLHITGSYTDIMKWLKRTQPEKPQEKSISESELMDIIEDVRDVEYKRDGYIVTIKRRPGPTGPGGRDTWLYNANVGGHGLGDFPSQKKASEAISQYLMRVGPKKESVELDEERDDFDSPITSKDIKMAIGIANDPRYKQGNYSAAYQKISRLKKDLQKHPRVRDALRRANEEHQCEIVDALMEEDGYYKRPLSSYERRFARTPEGRRDAYGDRGRAMEKIAEIKDKIQRAQERARKFEKLASAAQGNEKFGAHTGNEWRQKAQEKKKDIQKYQRQISNLQAGRHINDGITENIDEATLAARDSAVLDSLLKLVKDKLQKDLDAGKMTDINSVAKLVRRRIEKDTKRAGHSRMKNEEVELDEAMTLDQKAARLIMIRKSAEKIRARSAAAAKRAAKADMRKSGAMRGMADVKDESVNESDAAWAASLEKIARDEKIKSISKRDRETLERIADLMKNANRIKS